MTNHLGNFGKFFPFHKTFDIPGRGKHFKLSGRKMNGYIVHNVSEEQKMRSIVAGYLPGTDKSQYNSNIHIMRWLYLPVLMLQRIKSHILRNAEPGTTGSGPREAHSVPRHVHHDSVTEEWKCCDVCHGQEIFKWRLLGGCCQVWGPLLTDRGWVQWPVLCSVQFVQCTVPGRPGWGHRKS